MLDAFAKLAGEAATLSTAQSVNPLAIQKVVKKKF